MIKELKIELDEGLVIILTLEQAKQLRMELNGLFGEKEIQYVPLPAPSPDPYNPWRDTTSPYKPMGPIVYGEWSDGVTFTKTDGTEWQLPHTHFGAQVLGKILAEADETLTNFHINKCEYNG